MAETVSKVHRLDAFLGAGIGITAAAVIPGHGLGVGVLLLGAGYGALIFRLTTGDRMRRSVFIGTALMLFSSAILRDATWVVLPALMAGVLSLLSAAVPFRRFSDLFGAARDLFRLIRGWRIGVAGVVRSIPPDTAKKGAPLLRGLAVGVPLLAAFFALFVSADRAFARLAGEVLLIDVDFELVPARLAVAILAFAAAGALQALPVGGPAGWSWRLNPFEDAPRRVPQVRAALEWVLPLGMLVLLFGAFVAVQSTVLFGGRTYVLETTGLTYAEYARSGFFQLLLVAVLALLVIGAARRWVSPGSPRERLALEVLLGSLALLSIVILVSALYRLHLYVDAYGPSRARFGARLIMVWLALVLVAAVARAFIEAGPWIVRGAVLASAGVILIGIAQNPDAAIARISVDRWEATGRIDVRYLSSLSADAVPELLHLPDPLRSCVLDRHSSDSTDEPWSGWNLARTQARVALRDAGLQPVTESTCWQWNR